jgi:hypothetical protein
MTIKGWPGGWSLSRPRYRILVRRVVSIVGTCHRLQTVLGAGGGCRRLLDRVLRWRLEYLGFAFVCGCGFHSFIYYGNTR